MKIPSIDPGRITRETLDHLARLGRTTVVCGSSGSQVEVIEDTTAAPTERYEQRSETVDPKTGIALPAVPEYFFDQDKWKELISRLGDRERALHRISNPDPAALVLVRRQLVEEQSAIGTKAREEEAGYCLCHSLREKFRAQLISGQYVATGFQPPSIVRVIIPSELHRKLNFNFEEDVAMGGGYNFIAIRIATASGIEHQKSDVSTRIAEWLAERRTRQVEELKKTLLDAACRKFGDDCTTRVFDAAYRQVYGRKRGRPRKAGAK